MDAQALVWSGSIQAPVRVDGWPNPPRPFKTVMVHGADFIGRVIVQASLHVAPTEADWFDVRVIDMEVPLGTEKARTVSYNSRDRYVWMRCAVEPVSGRLDRITVL
jgi:hypothetical protein